MNRQNHSSPNPITKRFDSLTPLIKPSSVAIIGASADPTRIGGRPLAYMLDRNYEGSLYPVNPNRDDIQGIPALASIDQLPQNIDVAIVALPAKQILNTLTALGKKGVKTVIVFSSGFSEVGNHKGQEQLVAEAKRWNMRLLGPNSAGAFNANIGYYANFVASYQNQGPKKGRIGLATQSGAVGLLLFGMAMEQGIGTSISVATGNESDICLGDIIGWMAESDDVDVIAVYAEAINHTERFIAGLEAAYKARKPVILHKAGNSELGKIAALSHTASVASDTKLLNALLEDYAVISVESSEELIDIAYAASFKIYPLNNSLGVMTASGGTGVIASDVAERFNVSMPPMPDSAQAKLKAIHPLCSPLNPVDCTGHVLNDLSLATTFTTIMLEEGNYQSILLNLSQLVTGKKEIFLPALKAIREKYPHHFFVLTLISPHKYAKEYEAIGFALFQDAERAINAIGALGRLGEAFNRPLRTQPRDYDAIAFKKPNLNEAETKKLFAQYGISSTEEASFQDSLSASDYAVKIGFPVVMKILSPDILHKSEMGGVILNISDQTEVTQNYQLLLDRAQSRHSHAKIDGVLVAKQMTGGIECFIGIQNDPFFGPFIAFGLGGIFVEILNDIVFKRCPITPDEANEMIRSIKGYPLLTGIRGEAKADIPALAEMLVRMSQFAWKAQDSIKSIDINPVLVMPEMQGAFAVDAIINIHEVKQS